MNYEPPKLEAAAGSFPPISAGEPPLLPPDPDPASAKVWGFWATLGLGLATLAAMFLGQTAGVVLFVVICIARGQDLNRTDFESNGLMVSLATLFALPVTVVLCWLFARLKAGRRALEYLALKRAGWRSYVAGIVGLGVIMLIWLGMTHLFDVPEIPPFVVEAYRTAEIYPLLWFAIIIAAPIMEETLFRGFFFQGLSQSRAGAVGAILIPSVFWAMIHVQYGIHEIVLIFLFGILLGMLRLRSGSILPGVAIHAFSNLVSTIQVALYLRGEPL